MNSNLTRRGLVVATGALAASGLWLGSARDARAAVDPPAGPAWPTKPIHIIVPNSPGGGIDILARHMESALSRTWPQPIVIDYKPGANTLLGTDFVAKSPPDGYTLGLVVTSHVLNPVLRKSMPYDTSKDLAGVSLATTYGLVISASPKLPVNSLAELIAYGKAHPGKLSFASPGAGSLTHLAGEQLKLLAGFDMVHVPYKGSAGAYTDVSDGRVDLLFDPLFSSIPHIKSGRLKPLAVLSAKREESMPDIPAANETVKGLEVMGVNGIVVAGATPRPIVNRISADIMAALKTEDLRKRLLDVGVTPVGTTPEVFDNYVRTEIKRWETVVKGGNIIID